MIVVGYGSGAYIGYFFIFKPKTAYDMLISVWSSDVCSSDLFDMLSNAIAGPFLSGRDFRAREDILEFAATKQPSLIHERTEIGRYRHVRRSSNKIGRARVGKECVSTGRSR